MSGAMDDEIACDAVVDARGLACPIPLVRARQALMVLAAGQRVRVIATDPAAPRDLEEFALASGHRLLDQRAEAGLYVAVLEKA